MKELSFDEAVSAYQQSPLCADGDYHHVDAGKSRREGPFWFLRKPNGDVITVVSDYWVWLADIDDLPF